MLDRLRASLTLKLLAANLSIIVVGVVTLVLAMGVFAPPLFERNIHFLHHGVQDELLDVFRDTVLKALLVAAGAALVTALAFSALVTTRVVAPLRSLAGVARRIAAGGYSERVVVGDPDEVGVLGHALNDLAAALERAEQRRRELVGDVAHELRTPLATVDAYLEGLEDGVVAAGPETTALLRAELSRLRRLVDDLEEVSRAESGRLALEVRALEPGAAMEAAAGAARPEYEAKGVTLRVGPSPQDLPRVCADPDRLAQVLANLLANALRHTAPGGHVRLGVAGAPGAVAFSVADDGEGIAAEHLPHLFERFYRADPSRSRSGGGSGIGLAVAKALVEAHAGTIAAASEGPGQGATFTFQLPVAQA